ncbi:MAG: hypothetical protein ABSF44_09680 [Candidatus Bathyarchaeia archaeon]
MDKKNQRKKFEAVLQEAIDDAFSSLGEPVKKSIYFHLEHKFLILSRDIPCRIEDFSDALERIFGSGAKHLELLIMEKLYLKVNCSYKWDGPKWLVPDLTFKQYVELIRIGYEDREKIGSVEVIVDAGEKQEQRE